MFKSKYNIGVCKKLRSSIYTYTCRAWAWILGLRMGNYLAFYEIILYIGVCVFFFVWMCFYISNVNMLNCGWCIIYVVELRV